MTKTWKIYVKFQNTKESVLIATVFNDEMLVGCITEYYKSQWHDVKVESK